MPKIIEGIAIIGGVFAILESMKKCLHLYISELFILLACILSLVVFIYFFRSHFFEKLKPKEFFTADFDFRQPDDETIAAAIEGIFSFSKSQPYFIHVTPPNKEIEEIYKAFNQGGSYFIHIHGKPGEGKSMLAYHAIYQLKQRGILKCYSLKIDSLANEKENSIQALLNELDGLPTGHRDPGSKLILIDDAHRLPFAYELERQLRIEAEQGNGCFIWITTDLDPFDKTKKKTGELNINFEAYYMQLVQTLYQSEDVRIQKLMAGKFPKLDLAIAQTKGEKEPSTKQKGQRIKDVWTFNFVASDGFERLKGDVLKLKEEEKYILYLLSAHTAMTGEVPLLDTDFYNICAAASKPNWFQLSFTEFKATIRGLCEQKPEDAGREKRRMMLRLTEDSQKNVLVESLHFQFARHFLKEVSLTFPEGKRLEMLKAIRVLLNEEWEKFRYLTSFLKYIANDVEIIFDQNADWFKNYFEYLQTDHFDQYQFVIRLICKFQRSLFAAIFTDDYFHRHAFFSVTCLYTDY